MLAPPPPFLWQKNIWAGATLSPGATPRAHCTTENQVLQSPQPPEDSQQGVRARGVVPARGFEFQLPHFSCVTLCVGGWGGGGLSNQRCPPRRAAEGLARMNVRTVGASAGTWRVLRPGVLTRGRL